MGSELAHRNDVVVSPAGAMVAGRPAGRADGCPSVIASVGNRAAQHLLRAVPPVVQRSFTHNGIALQIPAQLVCDVFQSSDGFNATITDFRKTHDGADPVDFSTWYDAALARHWPGGAPADKATAIEALRSRVQSGELNRPPGPAGSGAGAGPRSESSSARTTLKRKPVREEEKEEKQGVDTKAVKGPPTMVSVPPATTQVTKELLDAFLTRAPNDVWHWKKPTMVTACWLWAITGLDEAAPVVDPQILATFVNENEKDAERVRAALNEDLFSELVQLGKDIRNKRLGLEQRTAQSGRKQALEGRMDDIAPLVLRLGWITLRANGFVAAPEAKATATIVLQYTINDGVGWEHWWVELPTKDKKKRKRTVIGSDSNRRDLQVAEEEAHMRGDTPAKGWAIAKFPVAGLKARQVEILKEIAEKPKRLEPTPNPPASTS